MISTLCSNLLREPVAYTKDLGGRFAEDHLRPSQAHVDQWWTDGWRLEWLVRLRRNLIGAPDDQTQTSGLQMHQFIMHVSTEDV